MKLLVLSIIFNLSIISADNVNTKQVFEDFIMKYNKNYLTDQEKDERYKIFMNNLNKINDRNKLEQNNNNNAVHGVTKFSDLTYEEFKQRYLTADISMKKNNLPKVSIPSSSRSASGLVDWTGIYTTPVKDQGYCGSCWAFSATEQIESDTMRTENTEYILSPEQIVQCDSQSYGCDGGWTESAYHYVKDNGGMTTEDTYPYTSYFGKTGNCSLTEETETVVTVKGYTTLDGEESMANYVQSTGPLSVCLDASNWDSYIEGIVSVCGHTVDHCVQVVGIDTDSPNPYWKVRNSWGTDWGLNGFILLSYGANTCAIATDPTYTTVKLV